MAPRSLSLPPRQATCRSVRSLPPRRSTTAGNVLSGPPVQHLDCRSPARPPGRSPNANRSAAATPSGNGAATHQRPAAPKCDRLPGVRPLRWSPDPDRRVQPAVRAEARPPCCRCGRSLGRRVLHRSIAPARRSARLRRRSAGLPSAPRFPSTVALLPPGPKPACQERSGGSPSGRWSASSSPSVSPKQNPGAGLVRPPVLPGRWPSGHLPAGPRAPPWPPGLSGRSPRAPGGVATYASRGGTVLRACRLAAPKRSRGACPGSHANHAGLEGRGPDRRPGAEALNPGWS